MPSVAAVAIPQLKVVEPNALPTGLHHTSVQAPLQATSPPHAPISPIDFRRPLVVSPYTSAPNLLDLRSLSKEAECQALALAMQTLRPITPFYTDMGEYPPSRAFNWEAVHTQFYQILEQMHHVPQKRNRVLDCNEEEKCVEAKLVLKAHTFHVITFHSSLLPTADRHKLGELDRAAHAEALAMTGGALLKYWFGERPDSLSRNLAMCIWRSRDDSLRAAGPKAGQPPEGQSRPHSPASRQSQPSSPSLTRSGQSSGASSRAHSRASSPSGNPSHYPSHQHTHSETNSSTTPCVLCQQASTGVRVYPSLRCQSPIPGSAHQRAKAAVPEMYASIVIGEWKLRIEWFEEEATAPPESQNTNDGTTRVQRRRTTDAIDEPDLVAFTLLPKENELLPDWKIELVQSRKIL